MEAFRAVTGLLLLLLAPCVLRLAEGQGLPPLDATDIVGSSSASGSLRVLYGKSKAWRRAFSQKPAVACSTDTGSLCAPLDGDGLDLTLLELATSPAHYDARLANSTGTRYGVVSAVRDQGSCYTCAAFASIAAAESAIASALDIDPNAVQLSDHGLAYCLNRKDGFQRTCRTPWGLREAQSTLTAALKTPRTITTANCTPNVLSPTITSSAAALQGTCRSTCSQTDDPNGYLNGQLDIAILGSVWEMQQHILAHGAAVTSLTLYDDFKPYFAANPKGIYPGPTKNAQPAQYHAVAVIGFDNDQEYWIAKNSWGPKFADGGFFRIAFGASAVASFGNMFGLAWHPVVPPPQQIDLIPDPTKPNCFTYTAKPSDFISGIANRFRLSVRDVLLSNRGVITDLDQSISGKTLELCGVDPALVPPSSERQALLQFKAQVDRFGSLEDWKAGPAVGSVGPTMPDDQQAPVHCSWTGVGCHPQTRHVVAIALQDQSLGGALPSTLTLQGLPELQGLFLVNTGLIGTLPPTYTGLKQLKALSLVGNMLSGSFPVAWTAGLKQLQLLNLARNQLTGTLPATVTDMPKLQVLNLTGNQFTGPIPSSWAKFGSRLQQLDVSSNRLTGTLPTEFGALSGLQTLRASNNLLTGQLPDAWLGMKGLVYLSLGSNKLNGTLPAAWGRGMLALRNVSLQDNEIAGTLPSSWKSLSKLQSIQLQFNLLTGPLPESWSALAALGALQLNANALNGTLPASWGAWKSLMMIDVAGNKLRGTLPASYGNWGALYAGVYANNQLSGSLPDEWLNMRGTYLLSLDHNMLSGNLPASWGTGMSRLNVLTLQRNNLSGPLPAKWSGMRSLFVLILNDNQLSGALPDSWASLKGLVVMMASNNRLNGTLPASWSQIPILNLLDVRCNQLGGPVPVEYINLPGELGLSFNELTGTLPEQWGRAGKAGTARLRKLELVGNQISGSVPASWSNLNLDSLTLYGNSELAGCLPAAWAVGNMRLLSDVGTCATIATANEGLLSFMQGLSPHGMSGPAVGVQPGDRKAAGRAALQALVSTLLASQIVSGNAAGSTGASGALIPGAVENVTGVFNGPRLANSSSTSSPATLPSNSTSRLLAYVKYAVRGTKITGLC